MEFFWDVSYLSVRKSNLLILGIIITIFYLISHLFINLFGEYLLSIIYAIYALNIQ